MKTKTIFGLLLISFSLFFASCASKNERVVPKDAVAVMKIDFKSIYKKADIDKNQRAKISKALRKENKEMGEKFDEFMEHPFASGLNITKPVYIFLTMEDINKEPAAYITMVVKSEKKFKAYLEDLNENISIEEEEDYNLICVDEKIYGVFDDDVVIFGEFNKNEDLAEEMIKQDKADSFFKTENGDFAKSIDGEVTFFADFSNVEWGGAADEIANNMMREMFGRNARRLDLEKYSEQIQNMKIGCGLSFEDDGQIIFTAKSFNEPAMSIFGEQPISTDMFQYVPNKNLLGICAMSVDCGPVADVVKTAFKGEGEEYRLIADLLTDMDGTIMVAANGSNENNLTAVGVLPIEEKTVRTKVNNIEYGAYDELVAEAQQSNVKIGGKDGSTYFAFNTNMKSASSSAMDNEQVAEAGEFYAYMYVDIPQAIKLYNNIERENIPAVVSNLFRSAELKAPTKTEASLVITLDTEDNALEFIVDKIFEFADL